MPAGQYHPVVLVKQPPHSHPFDCTSGWRWVPERCISISIMEVKCTVAKPSIKNKRNCPSVCRKLKWHIVDLRQVVTFFESFVRFCEFHRKGYDRPSKGNGFGSGSVSHSHGFNTDRCWNVSFVFHVADSCDVTCPIKCPLIHHILQLKEADKTNNLCMVDLKRRTIYLIIYIILISNKEKE